MDYDSNQRSKIIIAENTYNDLNNTLDYLLTVMKNQQAARAVLSDFYETVRTLTSVAESLSILEDEEATKYGYRRIGFRKHRYYLIYRIEEGITIVDRMLHELQDRNAALK